MLLYLSIWIRRLDIQSYSKHNTIYIDTLGEAPAFSWTI